MKYQVKDWASHFENDRSKTRKHCSFVCVPNKQHGMGFSRIMAEPDGAAIYGVWQLIIGACSQQTSRNGWLTSDGEQAGSAWGADDLSLKFRRPVQEIQRALEFLSSEKVGWLVVTEEQSGTHRALTAHSPHGHLEEKGNERREEKEQKDAEPALREFPEALRTARVLNKWGVWMNQRRGHKKPKSWAVLFNEQIEWLSAYSEPQVFEILSASIRNGWTGLFEPKGTAKASSQKPADHTKGF